MASRSLNRSSFSTASRARTTLWRYCATAIVDSTTISVITTSNSISVKPREDRSLPITIFRPVERRAVVGREDVKHVLPAPAGRVGFVLVRATPPFVLVRHRIHGHPPQELELAAGGVVLHRDAFHQGFEIRRISFAADLDFERGDLLRVGGI